MYGAQSLHDESDRSTCCDMFQYVGHIGHKGGVATSLESIGFFWT